MSPRARNGVFALVTALLCVVAIEASLTLLAAFSPRVRMTLLSPSDPSVATPTVPDERLGHRPNPLYPDHDDRGFRNPGVPERARIVVLGDSQTYGTGVLAGETWPRQLESLGEPTVYSMAFGGYGPGHSLLLWEEAMAFEPEVVIEAHYFGNDFYDAFHLVHHKGQLSELKTRDPDALRALAEAEAAESIEERVVGLFRMGGEALPTGAAADTGGGGLRPWIAAHSKIYGLLRRARFEITRARALGAGSPEERWREVLALARANPAYCVVHEGPEARTLFTPAYRLAALDARDPRIREGHRLSLGAILRMSERAREEAIRFVVLLIPTKELVFRSQAGETGSAEYDALIAAELKLRAETLAWLDGHGIETLDLLDPLRAEFEAGRQPYQVSHDGHPNAVGHRAIAEAVRSHLATPPARDACAGAP